MLINSIIGLAVIQKLIKPCVNSKETVKSLGESNVPDHIKNELNAWTLNRGSDEHALLCSPARAFAFHVYPGVTWQ